MATRLGSGARRAEVAHLKVSDTDSHGWSFTLSDKGRKDRNVMLSPALLDALSVH